MVAIRAVADREQDHVALVALDGLEVLDQHRLGDLVAEEALELGPAPTDRFDAATLWWRHERLQRAVARDPARLLPLFAKERDALEAQWLASGARTEPAAAFAESERRLAEWTARVEESLRAEPRADVRPGFVQRYWAKRAARAGFPQS